MCFCARVFFEEEKKISRRKQKMKSLGLVLYLYARDSTTLSLSISISRKHAHTHTHDEKGWTIYSHFKTLYNYKKHTHTYFFYHFFTKLSYFWGLCLNPSNSLFLSCLSRTNASTSFCKLCSFWTNHSAVNAPATAKPAWI